MFKELREKGIQMSDGSMVKLPPPIMAEGLDAAGQRGAMAKVADARSPVDQLVAGAYYSPVVVKVRKVKSPQAKPAEGKPAEDEGPAFRAIDMWFVARGDWGILTSKEFLESVMKTKDEGKSRVVSKSGVLTDKRWPSKN